MFQSIRRSFVFGLLLIFSALSVQADDIHKNDYKWFQFNLMRSQDAKIPFGAKNGTFVEMEFGGRSGIVDLYGFVDIFDIFNHKNDDFHDRDNMFIKLNPRFSLNAIIGQDLSSGILTELFIATIAYIGDRGIAGGLFDTYLGLGSDLKAPWFGKISFNAYARFVKENYGAANENKWDGYLLSTNWFKPFLNFANGSFISYQGYLDYTFAANAVSDDGLHSSQSLAWFNGIYWHSTRYAVGYGMKYFDNMALVKNNAAGGETSGIGHYFSLSYKM